MQTPMRALLPAVVLALTIVLAGPALAKDEEERGRGRGARVEVGDFSLGVREASGQYVSFRFNESGVHGFSAHGVPLFDLVSLRSAQAGAMDVDERGAKFELRSRAFRLDAHDNPTAATRLVTPNGQGLLTLAPNGRAVLDGEVVRFTVGNLSGTIRGDALRVNGQNVTSSNELLVFLQVPRGEVDKHRPEIGRAIAKRHVGAEATFGLADERVKEEVVSYGNVTMRTLKAERGNLTVEIEGHGTEGRVLVLNVDGRVVGAQQAGELSILLDNESVRYADGLADALDPDDDGYHPEAYVVFDPNVQSFQLMLTVPHYSVHTLTVNVLEIVTPSVVVGVVAGLALLVPSGYLLFRRK